MSVIVKQVNFADYDCLLLTNQRLRLWTTVSCGPRIIGLSLDGGENLLAVLPDAVYKTPSGIDYRFRGGHRLWHAPEDPERTYAADDAPVSCEQIGSWIRFIQETEPLTGIQKVMEVSLAATEPWIAVNHILHNRGGEPVELAPWAITQLRPGGYALLPHPDEDTGLLPNRRFALWPYTQMNSPHIHWGDQHTIIQANMTSGKLKIGWTNPASWLAYWNEGVLFTKYVEFLAEGDYYDYGSSSECFCDPSCLELETLGVKTVLEPGNSVTHSEFWMLMPTAEFEMRNSKIESLAGRIGEKLKEIKMFWNVGFES